MSGLTIPAVVLAAFALLPRRLLLMRLPLTLVLGTVLTFPGGGRGSMLRAVAVR